ncbi:MAG: proline racemase family protein [Bryobacteraceae bacterium]
MIRTRFSKARVIDSHTGGEPTRVVMSGGPDLGNGPLSERVLRFRQQFDWFRSALVNEPRGSDITIGALLCEPIDPSSSAAVIYFNNVGYLGMCGHGSIGLLVTLAYAGKISHGEHRIETPVGTVTALLHPTGEVTINNVASYRHAANAVVDVPGYGRVSGDIAWGGNWFFLVHGHQMQLAMQNVEALTDFTWRIRQSLSRAGLTGANGAEIDHIELFVPSDKPGVDSKNFVLCPGKAYDRSPCGTGTSAKMACLYADGKLAEGQIWRQESIIGSVFEGTIRVLDGQVYPSIKGSAFVTSEADLVFDADDPFCMGIPA